MSKPTGYVSRAQIIKMALASGALAACSGPINPGPFSFKSGSALGTGELLSTDRYGLNEMFSHDVFKTLDKKKLLELFDPAPHIDRHQQPYFARVGQQAQQGTVIRKIPPQGIIIDRPGTYTLGGNISWIAKETAAAAITIRASNVTLDLGGFTLKASIVDNSLQMAGILIDGPVSNVSILNGSLASITEYGILAKKVTGLKISGITVTGIKMENLDIRFITPSGIWVGYSKNVTISDCHVTNTNVTTDSCAGIQLISTNQSNVVRCTVSSLVNNDGAVQGFSAIGCRGGTTRHCTADSLQSHFHGNVLASGHTVLGFCPIFSQSLTYTDCSATGMTGCCDDCHAMSVFLDAKITVKRFHASKVLDGAGPERTGAKATGLEVYGVGVTIVDCVATDVTAINPQDLQAAAFSAWGIDVSFQNCSAANVSVVDKSGKSLGVGFGWAPDPRHILCDFGAVFTTYTDCHADNCDVAFDTWDHISSTWVRPSYTNCKTGFLVQPGAKRTLSCDGCSECVPAMKQEITNFATGNVYPQ
jgi:hypothetical protein